MGMEQILLSQHRKLNTGEPFFPPATGAGKLPATGYLLFTFKMFFSAASKIGPVKLCMYGFVMI